MQKIYINSFQVFFSKIKLAYLPFLSRAEELNLSCTCQILFKNILHPLHKIVIVVLLFQDSNILGCLNSEQLDKDQ